MRNRDAHIEAWLDDKFDEAELRGFEERVAGDSALAAEAKLAESLESSLRRSFEPGGLIPAGALRVAESLRSQAAPLPRGRSRTWVLGALGVCAGLAAACFVLVRMLTAENAEPMKSESAAVDLVNQALPETVSRARPDLEDIYCSAKAYAAEQDWSTCSTTATASRGSGGLIADHGESIGLWPTAALELEGPILSAEWPGSMIFAGSESGEMAVLIAERDALNTCCLDIELPEASDLRLHSWRVGEMLWFEVSPFEQPRLLPRLQSELQ